jgi:hypothetical protein
VTARIACNGFDPTRVSHLKPPDTLSEPIERP